MWHCLRCAYCSGGKDITVAAHAWNKHGLGRWGRGMTESVPGLQYFYHCTGAPGHGVEIPMQVGVNGSTEPSC